MESAAFMRAYLALQNWRLSWDTNDYPSEIVSGLVHSNFLVTFWVHGVFVINSFESQWFGLLLRVWIKVSTFVTTLKYSLYCSWEIRCVVAMPFSFWKHYVRRKILNFEHVWGYTFWRISAAEEVNPFDYEGRLDIADFSIVLLMHLTFSWKFTSSCVVSLAAIQNMCRPHTGRTGLLCASLLYANF